MYMFYEEPPDSDREQANKLMNYANYIRERTRNRFDSLTHSTVNIIYLSSKSLVPENEMEKLIIYFGGAYMIVCLRVLPCYTYSITRVL